MDHRSLVVCAMFRDDAGFLPEWIAYHCAIGFDRFVLYDNASTDGGGDLLRRFPLADRVTVIQWPQPQGQLPAYRHFIDIFAPAYEWAAFIDVDEFILPLGGASVQDTLRRCGQASAVLVNGRVFGPAGHEEPAAGLVIDRYDTRLEDAMPVSRQVKSIVRCADLLDVTEDPRVFRLKGVACNALGQEVPNVGVQPAACLEGLVINHYYTKSRRDWMARLGRDRAMGGGQWSAPPVELFDQLAAACQVRDETIKAYVPRVRALLAGGAAAPMPVGFAVTPASVVPPPMPLSMPLSAVLPPLVAPPPAMPSPVPPSMPVSAVMSAPAVMPSAPTPPEPPPSVPAPSGAAMPAVALATTVAGSAAGRFVSTQLTGGRAPTTARPAAPMFAAAPPPAPAPRWIMRGADALEYPDGLALVFRDRSRAAAPWLAALRGGAAVLIDPEFLLDEAGRLRDFPDEQAACAACEMALDAYRGG